MTKLEMINEMMRDLNFGSVSHNERVAKNCAKQPKWMVEKAYNIFKNDEQANRFCIACLNR